MWSKEIGQSFYSFKHELTKSNDKWPDLEVYKKEEVKVVPDVGGGGKLGIARPWCCERKIQRLMSFDVCKIKYAS